jgi:hypothetical protein
VDWSLEWGLVIPCATSLIYFVAQQIHRHLALRASS